MMKIFTFELTNILSESAVNVFANYWVDDENVRKENLGEFIQRVAEYAVRLQRDGALEAHEKQNTLTCVYCGMTYPEGTPPHGAQLLTDHIKICEKHPLRQAEATITKLRSALAGLVGASSKDELEAMERAMRATPAPAADKAVAIDAIHALIETVE